MTLVAPSQAYERDPFALSLRAAATDDSSLMHELDMLIANDQARFGFLLEVSLDGLWMWDLEMPDRGWMSPRFWERLGYDAGEHAFRASDWGGLMHPDVSRDVVARFDAYCAQPDHLYDEVLQYRHRDGSSVWLRCRGMAVRDADGRAVRLLGAHNDITALKSTEAALLRGQAELTQLLAKSSEANAWLEMAEQIGRVGHWRLSVSDQTLVWSSEMYHIHGVRQDSYSPGPESPAEFYHPDDRARNLGILATAMRDGKPFEFSTRLVLPDGALRHVQCRGVTRPDALGGVGMLVGVMVDVSEQKHLEQALRAANARLEDLANVDSLTGLANRRRFDETLVHEWRRAARAGTCLSLVMVDLDRFKGFNDRYGHMAGDECLRRVADVLAQHGRRPSDFAARYGGEEMVLLLPGTTAAGAEKVARECRSAIAALGICHEGNMSCGGVVTASFGVATALPPEDAAISDWADLLGEADRLLYEAKRTGRNKVVTQAGFSLADILPMAPDEEARLSTLARYQSAGATCRTQEMDGIARLAATLAGVPIALVSLIGQDEQFHAGNFGMAGVDSLPREISFCTHTILGDEPMVVADATRDQRFKANPIVNGDLAAVRYYAGAPIVSQRTGHKLGALCVIDTVAHEQTSVAERAILADLAGMVAALLEDNLKSGGS